MFIWFQNSQEDYEQALKHYELALSTFIKFLKGMVLLFTISFEYLDIKMFLIQDIDHTVRGL